MFEQDGAEALCMESLATFRPWAQVIPSNASHSAVVRGQGGMVYPDGATRMKEPQEGKKAREDANCKNAHTYR